MSENAIELNIKKYITDRNTYFVFPTEIAASMWADRATFVTECSAVAMERFIAWDKFKGEAVRSENQDRDSVPSIMRSIFAQSLIRENAEKHYFKNLIVPEYAGNAEGFTDWLAVILPCLGLWKEYYEKASGQGDEEDQDLEVLYEKYSAFLNKYNLFDPAWEKPPFKNSGKKYILFFPEINSDWEEYRKILEETKEFITIVHLDEKTVCEGDVNFFVNSRIEIKNAGTYVLNLHREKGLDWSQIAVNVPDLDVYGPYIERELDLLEIPHTTKYSRPLNSTGAGNLFSQILQCSDDGNSYDSVKELFLNTELPWKDCQLNLELIEYGLQNHCVCSYKIDGMPLDVWEESFKVNFPSKELKDYYYKFKRSVEAFKDAKNFEQLRTVYFQFRQNFFDMEKCSCKSNNILSRCISELGGLIDIEKRFKDCKVASPFNFYADYLGKVNYLEQSSRGGVQIFPYKTAACAPFACHIIVDSSQASLNVIFKELSFLNEYKRFKLLNREESNVSDKYISLYQMNSISQKAYFTCARQTFNNYSQVTSYLSENDLTKVKDENILFGNNPYNPEKNWFNGESGNFPPVITENQKHGFENWLSYQKLKRTQTEKAADKIKSMWKSTVLENGEQLPAVSYSSLREFYKCPREWFLKRSLGMEEAETAAEILGKYSVGTLLHKIAELFFNRLKDENLPLCVGEDGELTEEYTGFLFEAVDDALKDRNNDYTFMRNEIFDTIYESVKKQILKVMTDFCLKFSNCMVIQTEGKLDCIDDELKCSFKGQFDCLLQHRGSLQYYLIDFKRSKNSFPKNLYLKEDEDNSLPLEEQTLPDFQIPLYIYLLSKQKNPLIVRNAAYFDFKEGNLTTVFVEDNDSILPAGKDIPDYEKYKPVIDKTLESVRHFVERVKADDFGLDDKVQTFNVCSGCRFKAVCRKFFNVHRESRF
jgi:hypothetical protein